jgi:tetratricopeptide (TPR) repeat protein
MRSLALLNLGRFQEAMDAAGEVIAQNPDYGFAYVIRGGARRALGDIAGSEADFERALALDGSAWTRDQIARSRTERPR